MTEQEIAQVVGTTIFTMDDYIDQLVSLSTGPSWPGRMHQIKETIREMATLWYPEEWDAETTDEEAS